MKNVRYYKGGFRMEGQERKQKAASSSEKAYYILVTTFRLFRQQVHIGKIARNQESR